MLEPLSPSNWNSTTAAHLLKRAGFGGCPEDVAKLTEYGLHRAVNWFVDYEGKPDDTTAPEWAHVDDQIIAQLQAIRAVTDIEQKKEMLKKMREVANEQIADLRYWWVKRMATGNRPLEEKMTLFWHGHFATGYDKVKFPFLLYQQNQIFRTHATSTFGDILTAVSKDPAMLIYLDGATSKKTHPNENFAREVMELFTLGEGHYTEKDIQESARAYTGWALTRDRQSFRYNPQVHDDGEKTFLGQTGNFTGEECLQILADQPQTARFIAWKLWRFFVQDPAPDDKVDALARVLSGNGLDIKETLRKLFVSQAFYADDVIRSQIKSPVQWLVSGVRELQSPLPTLPMTVVMLTTLGQDLFQPPNVKGWDGGFSWITTANLLNRYNLSAALVEGSRVPLPNVTGRAKGLAHLINEMGGLDLPPASVQALFKPEELVNADTLIPAMEQRFLNGPLRPRSLASIKEFLGSNQPVSPLPEDQVRSAIRLVMSTPDYQLT